VTIPENVDAIHSMSLEAGRMSTKKVAETLAISLEKVDYRDFRHEKALSQMNSQMSES
jgi:hypothetical protein